MVPDDAIHDLPDHVAVQIAFLVRLVERGARSDDCGTSTVEEFATEFVQPWAGPLEQACKAAATRHSAAAVYAALARLACIAVDDPSVREG